MVEVEKKLREEYRSLYPSEIVLLDIVIKYGENFYKRESEVVNEIMSHIFTEEDKEKARKNGDGFEHILFRVKLDVAHQKLETMTRLLADAMKEAERRNKSIVEVLAERL